MYNRIDAPEGYVCVSEITRITNWTRAYVKRLCHTGQIPGAIADGKKDFIPSAWAGELEALFRRTLPVGVAAREAGVTPGTIRKYVISGELKEERGRIDIESLRRYVANTRKGFRHTAQNK